MNRPFSISIRLFVIGGILITRQPSMPADDERRPSRLTHPLLPGVRCSEIWNTDWPRTLHDKQLTGFSPLICGMKEAPTVWATIDVGGELSWVKQIRDRHGDRPLRVCGVASAGRGRPLWRSAQRLPVV
jgi:hypothetical protein